MVCTYCLEVDHLGDFVHGDRTTLHWSAAKDRGKVTTAPVDRSEKGSGRDMQRGETDHEAGGLPSRRIKPDLVEHLLRLFGKRSLNVPVPPWILAQIKGPEPVGQGCNLCRREWMIEVEHEYRGFCRH